MKLMNTNSKILSSAAALAVMLCLSMFCVTYLWAASGHVSDPSEASSESVEGSFDGLDLKARSIWINDMVYKLDLRVKVKGTSNKLGLITDLKQGETIRATLRPNEHQPAIPYVILIERQ
jgi:hypothetical protein